MEEYILDTFGEKTRQEFMDEVARQMGRTPYELAEAWEKDLALSSLYFDPPELIQGEKSEMVAVFQNRGTDRIVDGAAVIKIDDKEERCCCLIWSPALRRK